MRSSFEEASPNQSPFFEDVDLFSLDGPLVDAANRCGFDISALSRFGKDWGSAETLELGRLANAHPPDLRAFNAKGDRIDFVEFHPSYHALMRKSVAYGLHAPEDENEKLPVTARAMRFYVVAQAEAGHMCPITMTHAAPAALRASPDLLARWRSKVSSRIYDAAHRPWWEKEGATIGMGMTERQGGTDVRTNASRAIATGDHAQITGRKWFLSAPMCDAFLVLAQGDRGLSCYLMPRFRPDGALNELRIQRLKDKLGNRSNATCEVEFERAYAWPVGAPGEGVRTIIEMVQLTRLDCAFSSAGLMRMGLAQAMSHVRHRRVFGKRLIDQPAMRAVLADMALEMEAIVALVFNLARALDEASKDAEMAVYARLLTPAVKFMVCKAAPGFLYEAMECLGGNSYVEESPLARLYREAPVNAIWEGSGNVVALDALRAAFQAPDAAVALLEGMARDLAGVFDAAPVVASLAKALGSGTGEPRARFVCETLARLAALAALAKAGSPFASAYARTRFEDSPHATYGCCDLSACEEALLQRALVSG
jgi:putative acyl-CoA dehydrogenase